jgi:hypothetical protein
VPFVVAEDLIPPNAAPAHALDAIARRKRDRDQAVVYGSFGADLESAVLHRQARVRLFCVLVTGAVAMSSVV